MTGQEVTLRQGPREPQKSCQLGLRWVHRRDLMRSPEREKDAIGDRFQKWVWKEERPESEHQDVLEVLLVKCNN